MNDVEKKKEEQLYRKVVLGENDVNSVLLSVPSVWSWKFKKIKEFYGFEGDDAVLFMLINDRYHEIVSKNKT